MQECVAPTVWAGRFQGRVIPRDCSASGDFLEETEGEGVGHLEGEVPAR